MGVLRYVHAVRQHPGAKQHHDVRLKDKNTWLDRLVRGKDIGRDRRSAALVAIGGRGLGVRALSHYRFGEQLGAGDHTLTAQPQKPDLFHEYPCD